MARKPKKPAKPNVNGAASEPTSPPALTLDKLRAHAGTLAQVHAILAPRAVVADGTTQLVPADINAVLLARQFLQALHADLAEALAAAEKSIEQAVRETIERPIDDDANEQPKRLN